MKNTDKFLIAIVAGVVLLIGVAFAVVFLRPKPTYQTDDTPEGVAHNYLFALQQKDYARAYSYLSPDIDGYPDSVARFTTDISNNGYGFGSGSDSTTLEIASSDITGDQAVVTVRETVFYNGGLFNNNQYTNTFAMTLHREDKGWKIVSSESYWAWCWNDTGGCQ